MQMLRNAVPSSDSQSICKEITEAVRYQALTCDHSTHGMEIRWNVVAALIVAMVVFYEIRDTMKFVLSKAKSGEYQATHHPEKRVAEIQRQQNHDPTLRPEVQHQPRLKPDTETPSWLLFEDCLSKTQAETVERDLFQTKKFDPFFQGKFHNCNFTQPKLYPGHAVCHLPYSLYQMCSKPPCLSVRMVDGARTYERATLRVNKGRQLHTLVTKCSRLLQQMHHAGIYKNQTDK
eukprot:gene8750-401_t